MNDKVEGEGRVYAAGPLWVYYHYEPHGLFDGYISPTERCYVCG